MFFLLACAAVTSQAHISFPLFRFNVPSIRPHTWHRSLQHADDTELPSIPLHLGMGTHYTFIYVGTPPQRVSVILDTGSQLLAFPCSGCSYCGTHTDPPFDMKKSSSMKYISCKSHPFALKECMSCHADDKCILLQVIITLISNCFSPFFKF